MGGFEVLRMEGKQQPLARHKVGGVSAAVWENRMRGRDGQLRVVLKATVSKTYKDKSGAFQSTGSLGVDDIPKAIRCLEKAWDTMLGESSFGPATEETVVEEVVA